MDALHHLARHWRHVIYHSLLAVGVPESSLPDVVMVILGLILAAYLALSALIGRRSAEKGQSFWFGFLLALVTTPLIAAPFVALLRPVKAFTRGSRKRACVGEKVA